MKPVYKRIMLKLSGEALMAPDGFGVDAVTVSRVAAEIEEIHRLGVQVGIVIGGGNFFRGSTLALPGMDRVQADYAGMIATILNGLALQASLRHVGVKCGILSALEIWGIVPLFSLDEALKVLDHHEVVIFTAGTGNPFFTTDTAAALRGIQIRADALLKATKVDGVYDRDPATASEAKKFTELTYSQALQQNLKFMDAAAISMCRDYDLPIIVFNFMAPGNLKRLLLGEDVGTIMRG